MRRLWTDDEIIHATQLRDMRVPYAEIAERMGRTLAGVKRAFSRYVGKREDRVHSYYDGPAIGLTMECQRYRQDAKLGSAVLREACLDLFQRTANRFNVGMDDAMACHLGYHAPVNIPGRERIYKTASAMRLAA